MILPSDAAAKSVVVVVSVEKQIEVILFRDSLVQSSLLQNMCE